MKIKFFLLANILGVIFMTIPIFAADQAVPTPTLNELQGKWTGKIAFDDDKYGSTDATMSINNKDVAIGWGTGITGTVTVKGKDITIIGTGNQGGNWEFNLQVFNEAGKTILKGTVYVTGVGKKTMKGSRTGKASFEKIGSAVDNTPAIK
jgi:hypothetical protein